MVKKPSFAERIMAKSMEGNPKIQGTGQLRTYEKKQEHKTFFVGTKT